MLWTAWFIASVVLVIIEILTPGAFFFACLGIGAFAAGIFAYFSTTGWAQWSVFAVISLVSIYAIRPIARRFFQTRNMKTNTDALIGQKAWVTEAIRPPELGMVKVEGEIWRGEAQESIDAGTFVTVIEVQGTRLVVRK